MCSPSQTRNLPQKSPFSNSCCLPCMPFRNNPGRAYARSCAFKDRDNAERSYDAAPPALCVTGGLDVRRSPYRFVCGGLPTVLFAMVSQPSCFPLSDRWFRCAAVSLPSCLWRSPYRLVCGGLPTAFDLWRSPCHACAFLVSSHGCVVAGRGWVGVDVPRTCGVSRRE